MATPPVNTSSVTNSKLDVAGVVGQLMEVERRPLVKLESKIGATDVKISTLGQFQAKLGAVRDALNGLQTATNFTAVEPTFSRAGVATATTASAATPGIHTIQVTRLAQPNIWKVEGFASDTAARAWLNDSAQSTTRDAANASIIKITDNSYALWLTAKSGVFSPSVAAGSGLVAEEVQSAQSAAFSVNGYSYSRASNTVSDVVEGVTLNLSAITVTGQNEDGEDIHDPLTLTLAPSALTAKPRIEALVTAFNELQALYKKETQPSAEVATRGILNSDSTLTAIMREVTGSFARPLTGVGGLSLTGQRDLTLLGLKLTDKGFLQIDDSLLARSTDLQSRLAGGLRVGFDSATNKDLSQKITDMMTVGGMMAERVSREREAQSELAKRKTDLEMRLANVQTRLTTQFAALDALLFKLSNTSEALKSALDALTNSQKKG
jgi:flagellar hook-associated protein 2